MEFTSDDEYIRRERQEYPNRNVSVAILVDLQELMLLVSTRRLPNHWQPLGGGIKSSDASPESAVLREVREEFGVELLPSQLRRICETSYDFGTGTVYFFIAPVPDGAKFSPNTTEIASWRWVTLETAMTLPTFPATRKCLEFLAEHQEILKAAAQNSSSTRIKGFQDNEIR